MKKLYSLRLLLLTYAAAIIIAALAVTGIGLAALFERYAERRIGQELDVYIAQLAGGVRFDENGVASLTQHPSDPRFNQAFGGLYWQISKANNQVILRSRSLWDSELLLPKDELLPGQTHSHELIGPADTETLAYEKAIIIPTAQGNLSMRIAVAIHSDDLQFTTAKFTNDLIPALGILGLVLLIGFAVQIHSSLKPMQTLRSEIIDIRNGQRKRLRGPVPKEVEPLVDEFNALLDLQEKDMIKARDRAADLAHGLKTPLTALISDIARLREKGEDALATDIEELTLRMRRHLDRELVRARQRHGRHATIVVLKDTIEALIRTFERTPMGEKIIYKQDISPQISIAMNVDDLNDIFGNLLENATRYAKKQINITVKIKDNRALISIEDDGKGLTPKQIEHVLKRGQRLDTSGSGTGLGLAIVSDILDANNSSITLTTTPKGGLKATCSLPSYYVDNKSI